MRCRDHLPRKNTGAPVTGRLWAGRPRTQPLVSRPAHRKGGLRVRL